MQHTERAEHQLRHLPTYAEHALENVVAQSERQLLQLPLEQLFQSVEPCTLIAIIGTLIAIIGTLIGIIGTLIAIIGTLIGIIGLLQLPLEQLFQSVEPCHTDPCLVEYRALSPTSLVPSGTCMVPNATALRFPPSGTPRGTLSRPREHRKPTAGHAPVGQHAADSVPAVPRAHQRQTISCAL